jgi:hypothetical protein
LPCKFYWEQIKLQKYNIITLTYTELVKKYCNKNFKNKSNILLTDTTLILNKLGIDKTGYNPQIPKHKASKISLITDVKGVPLSAYVSSASVYDSKILDNQLDKFICSQ